MGLLHRCCAGLACENGANAGEAWRDRPTGNAEQGALRNSLRLTDKDKACQVLASPVASEADGTRTRNLRIDSPVL